MESFPYIYPSTSWISTRFRAWVNINPIYHILEATILLLALILWFQRAYKPHRKPAFSFTRLKQKLLGFTSAKGSHEANSWPGVEKERKSFSSLSEQEINDLCAAWKPQPLDKPPQRIQYVMGQDKDGATVQMPILSNEDDDDEDDDEEDENQQDFSTNSAENNPQARALDDVQRQQQLDKKVLKRISSTMPIKYTKVLTSAATVKTDIIIPEKDPNKEIKSVLNLSASNFLGLLHHSEILSAANRALEKYGLGSCGPRGFYGTMDIHLECEELLAKWSGVESAILYSFGSATISSTIPAFCKRNDVLVVDQGCGYNIQNGVALSRSTVMPFKHNDLESLETILKEVTKNDIARPTLKRKQRRFIVVEGIYTNYGDLCPLDKIIELKKKYDFRIILDESISLGALGETGKGIIEHFKIDPADIDIRTADLGNSLATIGGFCCGVKEVASHQRLSGAGYCFSASQPPYLVAACIRAIEIMQSDEGKSYASNLRRNVCAFLEALGEIPGFIDFKKKTQMLSPWIFLRRKLDSSSGVDMGDKASTGNGYSNGNDNGFTQEYDMDRDREKFILAHNMLLDQKIMVAIPEHISSQQIIAPPALRVAISAAHSVEDLRDAALRIREIMTGNNVFQRLH